MEVQMTSIYGRSWTYVIDETWTVLKLKNLYSQDLQTSPNNWYFMFEGKFLKNSTLLVDYNIKDGSVIHVTNRIAHRMTYPVELHIVYTEMEGHRFKGSAQESSHSQCELPQKTVLIYAEVYWSVERVKREFAQLREIPDWKSYRLLANGIPLSENNLLKDYHICNDATLYFVQKVRSRRFGIANLKKYVVEKFFLNAI